MKKYLIKTTLILLIGPLLFSAAIAKQIDRYTIIKNIETSAQADVFKTIIDIKFPKSVLTVGQAIDYVLLRSGYKLTSSRASKIIKNFKLPDVHRQLGPIELKRALDVLLGIGSAYQIRIDRNDRSITITSKFINENNINKDSFLVLNPNITKAILTEIVAVSIENEKLPDALKKVLPNDWEIRVRNSNLEEMIVNVAAEEVSREEVINKILLEAKAVGYFYKKLKLLIIKNNIKIIN